MSITDAGRTLMQVTVTHLSTQRGVGVHRLVFSLKIDLAPTPEYSAVISQLAGFIYAGTNQKDVRPLAALSVETSWFTTTDSTDARQEYLALYCDLSSDQLGAIETMRNGASLMFKLDLRVVVQGQHGLGRGDTQAWFEATPTTWVNVLKELGYAEILLLGVELPLHDVPAELGPAVEEILQAHLDLLAGRFGETIRRCRMALDSVDTVLKLVDERESAMRAFVASRTDMTKHQRALLVANSVRHYTHLGHHVDAQGRSEEFARVDAAFILGAAASTLWNALHMWRLRSSSEAKEVS